MIGIVQIHGTGRTSSVSDHHVPDGCLQAGQTADPHRPHQPDQGGLPALQGTPAVPLHVSTARYRPTDTRIHTVLSYSCAQGM